MGGREGEVVTSNQSLISNTKAITGSCSLVFRLTESPSWVGGPLLVPYTGLSLRYGFCIDVFPPPFFEPSQGMGLTTSYKNVVRVSLHLQGFTISPKKSRSFGYACRGKNNAIRRKSRGWFMREGSRVEGKVNLTLDYPVFWIDTARVTDLSTFPLVILLQKLLGKLRDVQKLIAETVWKTCCWKVTIASCIIVSIVIIYSRLLDYF